MRRILVERAEHRVHSMRDGASVLDGVLAEDARFLDQALTELEAYDPALCRLAELRLLCNLSNEQAATALGTSSDETKRNWDLALGMVTDSLRDQHAAHAD